MLRVKWLAVLIFFLFAASAIAADSTSLAPQASNSTGDLDMYGHNISNVGAVNTGSVTLTQTYAVGDVCEEGQLGRDADGEILACKSGIWAKAQSGGGSFGGSYVEVDSASISNPFTGNGSCPAGFESVKIDIYRTMDGNVKDGVVYGCYKPSYCQSSFGVGLVRTKSNRYCKFDL